MRIYENKEKVKRKVEKYDEERAQDNKRYRLIKK